MANTIYVGDRTSPAATFLPDNIYEVSGFFSSALIGDTLNVDTLAPLVGNGIEFRLDAFIPSGSSGLQTRDGKRFLVPYTGEISPDVVLRFGVPVWWYADSELKGKFYVTDVERIGRAEYSVSAVSAIGLLDRVQHMGGMYAGQSMGAVLADIIGSTFPYTVSSAVAAQKAYGWLPAQSARENLHWLMTAYGINITKDANGDPYFQFVAAGTPTAVPQDRIFLGGSVRRGSPASRVEVTEHQFVALESGELVTVFDNTDGSAYADHRRVTFRDAPVFGLTASSGLTIHTSNCNYAEFSGIGTITARKYAHITSVIGKDNPAAAQERVQGISGDTMISSLNSWNVLERLYGFYTAGDTISADLKVTTELPNQLLTLQDAFGDERTGWLKSLSFNATTFIRAKAELITGYTPGNFGNNFTHAQLVTSNIINQRLGYSGRVRIVLIQGGEGGQGGGRGLYGLGYDDSMGGDLKRVEDSDDKIVYYDNGNQRVPTGGLAGEPGKAGKVFTIDLTLTGNDLWTIHLGVGGAGGEAGGYLEVGRPGSPGTHTTAQIGSRSYSSNLGSVTASGVQELISGEVYGKPGSPGYKGGDGGIATPTTTWGYAGDGAPGESVAGFSGGSGGEGLSREGQSGLPATAGGGGGGGAAYGAAGSPGEDATYVQQRTGSGPSADWRDYYTGGTGGNGANALPPPDADYGCGGDGGNGGGGGGNAAGARVQRPSYSGIVEYVGCGNQSEGGTGSRGGNGGAGLCIIYYA